MHLKLLENENYFQYNETDKEKMQKVRKMQTIAKMHKNTKNA